MKRVSLTIAMVLLCLVPASILALRGIQSADRTYSDCKGTGGLMRSELLDFASPSNYAATLEELKDGAGNTHGAYGAFSDTVDATSYGRVRPWVTIFKGCTEGNSGDGNSRKVETSETDVVSLRDDLGEYQLRATCADCTYGEWTVVLRQRIWQKLKVTWAPNFDGLAPEWKLVVLSQDLVGHFHILTLNGTYESDTGVTTNATSSTVDPQNPPIAESAPFYVKENGETTDIGDEGEWTSEAWNPNDVNIVEAWCHNDDIDLLTHFRCQQTTTHPKNDVYVLFTWRLSVEEIADPQPDYDEQSSSTMLCGMEYGTVVFLWSITVTTNCDATSDLCSCLKYQNTSTGKPDTP